MHGIWLRTTFWSSIKIIHDCRTKPTHMDAYCISPKLECLAKSRWNVPFPTRNATLVMVQMEVAFLGFDSCISNFFNEVPQDHFIGFAIVTLQIMSTYVQFTRPWIAFVFGNFQASLKKPTTCYLSINLLEVVNMLPLCPPLEDSSTCYLFIDLQKMSI
jgi:hypothetical protein